MKKTRLIIFAFTLALLVCAFVGFNTSAEEEGALEIKSMNLVYNDKVELLVAVDIDNSQRDNVEVTYTLGGESYKATLHPTETYTKDGVTYPVFYTVGIAPKDIDSVMTFEAHIKDSGAKGEAYSASILDYLYARLYKNGYIDKTEGDDLKRKELYINTINYASSAKDVLVNVKEGKSEPLFSDYFFAWSNDESFKVAADRFFGAFAPGSEITPVFVGEGSVSEWNLFDAEGVSLGTAALGTAVALNCHTEFSKAVLEDSVTVMDYENGASNAYVSSKDADGNPVSGAYVSGSSLAMGLTTKGDNTYLQVRNPAGSGKIGVTTVNLSNTIQTGNCYTFETKINIEGATGGNNFAQLVFVNNNGGEAVNLYLKATNNASGKANFAVATTGTNSNFTAGTVLFDYNDKSIGTTTWFTLRVEFYFEGAGDATAENTYMKLYVDDILAYSGLAHWALGANINRVEIRHVSAGKTHNTCYDDIFFTRTNKAYTE